MDNRPIGVFDSGLGGLTGVKQLRKLITVIKVVDLTEMKSVLRELVFLKVNATDAHRAEILRTVDIFRCKVVDVSVDEITIEATGTHEKIDAIVSLLTRFGIKEIAGFPQRQETGKLSGEALGGAIDILSVRAQQPPAFPVVEPGSQATSQPLAIHPPGFDDVP